MEFITNNSQKICGKITPMVVLVTDRVEEGSLGMVTTFCCHDQAKVESSEALSTLVQQDSPKLSVVVLKIFTNSPYLPWESSGFHYLDVTTLSIGACQPPNSPLASAVPMQAAPLFFLIIPLLILPYSSTLPCVKEEEGLKVYPFLKEALWESSEEDHCMSDSCAAVDPSLLLPSSLRRELTDQ